MTDDSESRRQGVSLGGLDDDLEQVQYPATAAELAEKFGDRELDLVDGSEQFDALLQPYLHDEGDEHPPTEESSEEFESAEAVRTAIMNLVGSDAIGREEYSDRGDESDDFDRTEESI